MYHLMHTHTMTTFTLPNQVNYSVGFIFLFPNLRYIIWVVAPASVTNRSRHWIELKMIVTPSRFRIAVVPHANFAAYHQHLTAGESGRGGSDPVQADVIRSALPVLLAGVILSTTHTHKHIHKPGLFLGLPIYIDSLPSIVLYFPFSCESDDIAGQQKCLCVVV